MSWIEAAYLIASNSMPTCGKPAKNNQMVQCLPTVGIFCDRIAQIRSFTSRMQQSDHRDDVELRNLRDSPYTHGLQSRVEFDRNPSTWRRLFGKSIVNSFNRGKSRSRRSQFTSGIILAERAVSYLLSSTYFRCRQILENLRSLITMTSRWRIGTETCTITTLSVFCLCITLLVWTVSVKRVGDGFATIYAGKCDFVASKTTQVQLIMNVLSSLVLGTSSYYMQTLTAPTRKDIDRTHARGQWLDVGSPSVRNLIFLGPTKRLHWVLLLVGCIPLHIL